MEKAQIKYVGDPMCPWCWGFSPIVKNLMQQYEDHFDFSLVVGGLRVADKAMTITEESREYIRDHWECAGLETGQPFDLDFLDEMDFTYDTEPACRAVVAMRKISPSRAFDFERRLQTAFYTQRVDPTTYTTFEQIAVSMGINARQFHELYHSPSIREETWSDFEFFRSTGERALPLMILERDAERKILARGFTRLAPIQKSIETYLEEREKGKGGDILLEDLDPEEGTAACTIGGDCCGD